MYICMYIYICIHNYRYQLLAYEQLDRDYQDLGSSSAKTTYNESQKKSMENLCIVIRKLQGYIYIRVYM
jgi:capsid protein